MVVIGHVSVLIKPSAPISIVVSKMALFLSFHLFLSNLTFPVHPKEENENVVCQHCTIQSQQELRECIPPPIWQFLAPPYIK